MYTDSSAKKPLRRFAPSSVLAAGVLAIGSLLGGTTALAPSFTATPAHAGIQPSTPAEHIVDYRWEPQNLAYNCGPFAMRSALSAFGIDKSADELAAMAGTTEYGTNFGAISPTMNAVLGQDLYQDVWLNQYPTQAEKDKMWNDVVASIDAGQPVIVNLMVEPGQGPSFYPTDRTVYHFVAVVGYDTDYRTFLVSDSGNFGGRGEYWLDSTQVADMAGGRGYFH